MSSPVFDVDHAYATAWKIIHAKKPPVFNALDLEDYVQEMVTLCYMQWDKLDLSRGTVGQFLYTVCIHRLYSLIKQYTREATHQVPANISGAGDSEQVLVVEVVADTQRADPAEKAVAKEIVSNIIKFARRHGIFRTDELDRLRASIFQNRIVARDDPSWAKRRKTFSVRRALVLRELALEYAA